MNTKRKKKWIWMFLGIVLFIGAVVLISLKAIDLITENKRASAAPPTVQIVSPIAGDVFSAGETVFSSTTAIGTADIQLIELMLNGESVGKAFNDAGSSGAFDGRLDFIIQEGAHMLSARTVDQNGMVGQSIPIPIHGILKTDTSRTLAYTSREGDTLVSIADDLGVDLDDLRELNPDLGDGELTPGTSVNLPDDDKKDTIPEPPPTGGDQPGQPGAEPKKDTPPPNTPMLSEIIGAIPIFRPINVLMQTKPPQAPDGLEASHEDCLVTLQWNDNSEYEDTYRIWFTGLGMPARVIATVSSSEHTGRVWYQFPTPPAGIYGFWVEAVNAIGAQPSEEAWLGVPATQCEDYTAAYLNLIVDSFEIKGNFNRTYCYMSLEGTPEQRIPTGENSFFNDFVQNQLWGDFFQVVDLNKSGFTIPYPEDGSIDISGECLAWSGDSLNTLGEFDTVLIPDEVEFVGSILIETPNFRLWVSVVPAGFENPPGTYTFSNPLVKAPFNLQITDTGRSDNPFYPTNKCLSWEWKGDESEIEGFTVFLNDNPFKLALPHERSVCYSPPAQCGMHMRFEVAANLPNGQTPRSEAKEYDMERCPLWAEIQFVSIETGFTNDSLRGKCDEIETYFELKAWGATDASRNLGIGSDIPGALLKGQSKHRFNMTCNQFYTFDEIGYAVTNEHDMDKLVVQIDPNKAFLEIGIFGWDYDWGTENDPLVMNRKKFPFLPVVSWDGYEEEFSIGSYQEAGSTSVIVRVRAIPEPPSW